MESDIKKIIEKNLPAQVGDVLKKRLDQADSDAKELESLRENVKKKEVYANELQRRISEYTKFDERNGLLNERDKSIREKEQEYAVSILGIKLLESEKRADAITGFVQGLVRNTIFKKTILDTETCGQPVVDANGYAQYPVPTTKELTETKTEE